MKEKTVRKMEEADSSSQLPAKTWKKLKAELVRGQESATQLQILLQSVPASEHKRRLLAAEISKSFTEALLILGSSESSGDELRLQDSLCSDLDSGDCRRSSVFKDPVRCPKRRRVSETRIVVSPTVEDGHAWRKYGQKTILNAKHPRSYYRCTHKYDQGCGATKHVQKTEGDSDIYNITYIGHHTCGVSSPAYADELPLSDSYNICFSDSANNRQDSTSRFYWPAADDDAAKGETTSGLTDETDLWSDLKDFGNLQETTAKVAQPVVGSDYGDSMSDQYCFSIGDDADSHMFSFDFLSDLRFQ